MSSRTRPALLVVDDDAGSSGLLREVFVQEGYDVSVAQSGADALKQAAERPFDVVLSDIQMPDIDGIEVLRRLRNVAPDATVILVTAYSTIEMAIRALNEGAFDYVRKPFKLDEVRRVVERAMERRRAKAGAAPAPAPSAGEPRRRGRPISAIIGSHPDMVELFKLVSRVAGTKSSVMIQGESGTGKELIARTIHEASTRRDRPFVAVNCTSFSETLLESELFGHVKGAFTGAIERRPGLFLEANRGTVFLDEVGDMSLSMQAKLLRVLQEEEVKPVGGTDTIPVDVRVVAATHQDLEALVRTGRFRLDLYYRLHVVALRVPPLRERRDDIPLLAEHFLREYGLLAQRPLQGFSTKAMRALMNYPWPGNVRELENVVEGAVALAPGSIVEESDLPDKIVHHAGPVPATPGGQATLDEMTRRYVLSVLDKVRGNKTEAARILGVPRRTLYRMLERYGVGTEVEVSQSGTSIH
ncbi:MAG TPA: sigma-54 dependent transcriptional regulator [Candidatus Eisenbacteria bacterium]|jgi:DNA-binding NtrC family response regulator|nr:sigma-54 dependent transcriptional regulator [Candidatus Eisenbacteria bacterium]